MEPVSKKAVDQALRENMTVHGLQVPADLRGATKVAPGAISQQQVPWTLWEEANSLCAALDKLVEHCRLTRHELEQRLIELERMLGSMPKRLSGERTGQ